MHDHQLRHIRHDKGLAGLRAELIEDEDDGGEGRSATRPSRMPDPSGTATEVPKRAPRAGLHGVLLGRAAEPRSKLPPGASSKTAGDDGAIGGRADA
jgi:hypothetical protein